MKKKSVKYSGVYERPEGSGSFTVRYFDEFGKDRWKSAGRVGNRGKITLSLRGIDLQVRG